VAHPSEVASGKWHIEGHYPTQAKGRLEWGTQRLLPVDRRFEVVTTRQLSRRLLEWDTTALDQVFRFGSLNSSVEDLDFQMVAFMELYRVCKVHPGLLLVLLHSRG
jgi:hypothetical protein